TTRLELGGRDGPEWWLRWSNLGRHAWRRVVASQVSRIMLLDILGDIDQHWPRPIPSRQCEGLLHHRWNTGYAINEKTLFSNGGRDRYDVHLLKGILAKQVGGNVAGNRDDRHGIAVGIGDAGHEVSCSGSGGRQTHAHFPSGSGEA